MTSDRPPVVETVVVRAARLPPSPADAAFSVLRLGPEALKGRSRLDEALSQVPGLSLFRRTSSLGANPTTQGVSLRGIAGSGASRALVTLDGVPQNDPFGGWVIWTSLPPEDLAGATVVRGAGAGPYGAGALTGVIALDEATPAPGAWSLHAQGGSLSHGRGAATADIAVGSGSLFVAGSAERSDGWVPVRAGRGAADRRLTLRDEEVSAKFQTDQGAATAAIRAAAYREDRGSGLAGAASRAQGGSFGLTVAKAPTLDALGWRAQVWTRASDLSNTSVSVAPDRSSTTLTNDQYRTPAVGYGANLAVRRLSSWGTLEVGADLRGEAGEDRERFRPVAGVLTSDRRTGGQTLVGGVYGEGAHQSGPLLLVAGLRLDGWDTFDSHRLERRIATGAVTLDLHPPARSGVTPSARVAARLDLAGEGYLRAAAYSGFRPPTLNELYRPFRVGNDVTEANADLTPERLYGVEAGGGGSLGPVRFNADGFYNRLGGAILNVTLRGGPFLDPVAGFIPAGGVLRRRGNVSAVEAWGVEGDLAASLGSGIDARAAVSWTHARVDGGEAAPALTGLAPAETPRLVATWGVVWRGASPLTLACDLRYESARFDDDQNRRRLAPAATLNARAEWRIRASTRVFVAADNLFDIAVATGQTAGGVTSYGPPRTVRVGFSVSAR